MDTKSAIMESIFCALFLCVPAYSADADVQQTARPGTLNYVEGQAALGTDSLAAASVGKVEVGPGQSLKTQAGKAEILLTPGVFLRLGDGSSATMISPSLIDTEVDIDRGEATVEVAELHKENQLRIVEDGIVTELERTGLYDFNADQHLVRVFDGQAVVQEAARRVKVKGGHELTLGDDPSTKTQKFDKKTIEEGDLYRWTSLRSSYLAEANTDAARTYMSGGAGWFGDGWYWDPWFDSFTFIPGDGIFYSPFGWGFYSPGFAYAAPVFYGGYRHFGLNYHAWSPGAHYGMPGGYGHGVHYGANRNLGAGRSMGIYGRGFPGGGAVHSMGGFHGGGGGGFHGGGMHH